MLVDGDGDGDGDLPTTTTAASTRAITGTEASQWTDSVHERAVHVAVAVNDHVNVNVELTARVDGEGAPVMPSRSPRLSGTVSV